MTKAGTGVPGERKVGAHRWVSGVRSDCRCLESEMTARNKWRCVAICAAYGMEFSDRLRACYSRPNSWQSRGKSLVEYRVVTRGQKVIKETQPGVLSNANSVSRTYIVPHQKSDASIIYLLMPASPPRVCPSLWPSNMEGLPRMRQHNSRCCGYNQRLDTV